MHEVVELAPCVGVEPGGRLIQEQQVRPADDAYGDVHPAALAAGEGGDPLSRVLVETHGPDQIVDVVGALVTLRAVRSIVPAKVREQLPYPPLPMVPPGLQYHPYPRPPSLITLRRIHPEHPDLPGRTHPEPLQDLDSGSLASPIGPQ